MIFFINSGVCKRGWYDNTKITFLTDSKLEFSIFNYLDAKKCYEQVKFIFPNMEKDSLKKDVLLDNITFKETNKNTYYIEKKEKSSNHHMYALLRSTVIVPDDIWIPASMKDRVTIIKRIQTIDCEVDYGDFLSNTYLIRINLKPGECLPVYLTSKNPVALEKHYVFYKDLWEKDYHVEKNLETFILLNRHNKHKYISLSDLCD